MVNQNRWLTIACESTCLQRLVAVSLHYLVAPEPTHVVMPLTVADACIAMGGNYGPIYDRCENTALGLSGAEQAVLVTDGGSASGLQTPAS